MLCSFWPQCSWYVNLFTLNCNRIHLLSEHLPPPIPTFANRARTRREQKTRTRPCSTRKRHQPQKGKKPDRSRNNDFGNNQPLKLILELPPPAPKIFRALEKKIIKKKSKVSAQIAVPEESRVLQSLLLSQHQQPKWLAQFCPLNRGGLISLSSAPLHHSTLTGTSPAPLEPRHTCAGGNNERCSVPGARSGTAVTLLSLCCRTGPGTAL